LRTTGTALQNVNRFAQRGVGILAEKTYVPVAVIIEYHDRFQGAVR